MRTSLLRSLLAACLLGGVLYALTAGGAASGQQYPLPPPPPPPPPPATLKKLKPFPVLRIKGFSTRRGAKVTLLTVRAKVGVVIVSRCKGKAKQCPYKERVQQIKGKKGKTKTVSVNGFQRGFRAGVKLRIFVVSDGRIGKFTSYGIRRRKKPRRYDRCVRGLVLTPVLCSKV
jgi:hypothetical protein